MHSSVVEQRSTRENATHAHFVGSIAEPASKRVRNAGQKKNGGLTPTKLLLPMLGQKAPQTGHDQLDNLVTQPLPPILILRQNFCKPMSLENILQAIKEPQRLLLDTSLAAPKPALCFVFTEAGDEDHVIGFEIGRFGRTECRVEEGLGFGGE